MPEGPEVFTFSRSLQPLVGRVLESTRLLSGRYIRHGPPVNFKEFNATLPAKILSVEAKGKLLYMTLENERSIWFTLAMTGAIRQSPGTHDRVEFQLSPRKPRGKREVFYFSDIRNFGTVTFGLTQTALDTKLQGIGKSFLGSDRLVEEEFESVIDTLHREKPIAAFLMEQKKVSGVGNYILSEAFYRARLYPFITAGEITAKETRALYDAIISVVDESVAAEGATLKKGGTYKGFGGDEGGFVMEVYGKTEDTEGRKIVKEIGPHKRSLWWVPEVQSMKRARRRSAKTEPDIS